MKNWKEAYPLNTLKGESREEFEVFIEELLRAQAKEWQIGSGKTHFFGDGCEAEHGKKYNK